MKITRVKHIDFFPVKDMFEEVDLKLHGKFEESKADFTKFVPTSESVRSLPAGDIGLQHYDYPDGRDDGRPVPIGRRRGVDIAELSEEVRKQQGSIAEQWQEYKVNEKLDSLHKEQQNQPSSELKSTGSNGGKAAE